MKAEVKQFQLTVPEQILNEMIEHASQTVPDECCGLLAGQDGAVVQHYPIRNIVAKEGVEMPGSEGWSSPTASFVMDPKEMMEAIKDMKTRGMTLQVIYHSHPMGLASPSSIDVESVAQFDVTRNVLSLPQPTYMIVSLNGYEREYKSWSVEVNRFSIVGDVVDGLDYDVRKEDGSIQNIEALVYKTATSLLKQFGTMTLNDVHKLIVSDEKWMGFSMSKSDVAYSLEMLLFDISDLKRKAHRDNRN